MILRISARPIAIIQLVLSVYLLLKGHNEPGGGFIGGLIAASAFILIAMAFNVKRALSWLRLPPLFWIGLGLLVSISSGLVAWLTGKPFLSGVWGIEIWLPVVDKIKIGTPLFFDIGVYLVVIGITTLIIFTLLETEDF